MITKEEIQEIEFEIERICSSRALSGEDIAKWRYSSHVFRDFMLDTIVIELIRDIAAWRGKDKQTISYPADWWQAVKDRFFPRWAKRKWPVRCETRTFEAALMLPELPIPDNRLRFPVLFMESSVKDDR